MDSSLVYLVQTDTTVGFSSLNDEKLSFIKQRPTSKKILHTVDSFKTLTKNARVPKSFRKRVRNSKRTTFIYPNTKSFRVLPKDSDFYNFIHIVKNKYPLATLNATAKAFIELIQDQPPKSISELIEKYNNISKEHILDENDRIEQIQYQEKIRLMLYPYRQGFCYAYYLHHVKMGDDFINKGTKLQHFFNSWHTQATDAGFRKVFFKRFN